MRIIAGSARGIRLLAPDGQQTRPTSDMVREALFNMIANNTPDARFLDLFAGTGAIGLEALSRGASCAVFVDKRRECAQIIKKNAEKTGLSSKTRIIALDAARAVKQLSISGELFDIIYIDPPYDAGLLLPILAGIADSGILSESGIIIAEQSGSGIDTDVPLELANRGAALEVFRTKRYGGTVLDFYQAADRRAGI